MKNCRKVEDAIHRPSGPVAVAKSPITNEPETLMTNVPQGKVSPTLLAMKPEAPHRARLPKPPPTNIHSAFHINPTAPRLVVLVGVISAETDQAVFPFGKANSIAATNCGTTPARLATGISGARVLDSRPAAPIMRPALETVGAFGNRQLTNRSESKM